MFTGLIETMGTVIRIRHSGRASELAIRPDFAPFDIAVGGSVAVDGACLTVERIDGDLLVFTAVAETLSRTTLERVVSSRRVNLERALRLGDRLDGHMVLGHVDGVGKITSDKPVGISVMRTIRVPTELSRYMAAKGSVAVDGISLTIAAVGGDDITISIIPHTLDATTLSVKRPGDTVNIECDVISRYIERLMSSGNGDGKRQPDDSSLLNNLERFGF